MKRSVSLWFGVAGALTLIGWVLFMVGDPVYYDAATPVDYASVVGLTGCLVLTGIALIVLWRNPPVTNWPMCCWLTRGSLFLLLAGAGAVAEGLGNLLEDAFDFDVEEAAWAFFGGGLLMMVSLLVAGIAALTDSSHRRWTGLFLLFAVPGGMLGFGMVMMGIAWMLLGLWIAYEHRTFVIAQAIVALPAAAIAIDLYWADVVG